MKTPNDLTFALGKRAESVTTEQFWKIVDHVKGTKGPEVAIAKLLRKLTAPELISYQEHFDRFFRAVYRWDLWGAAYIIGGGCSDDGFIDFRYGLIAMGREIYE